MHESFRLPFNPPALRSVVCTGARSPMIVMLGGITRRTFVERSAKFFLMRALLSRATIALRIGVASPMSHDQRLGLDLGLDEARHAAALFGGTIVDIPLSSPRASDGTLSAIIGGGDESSALMWIRGATQARTIYLNVGATSDRLRGADCARAAFHVVPSDAMARDAIGVAGGGATARAEAWDGSLTRFGADTLNQRFLTRFHEPMTSDGWASWFAVKVLWESALRQRSGDASRIAEYLAADSTQFDGHKGSPLSFRSWDHQLRQPLYVTSPGAGKLARVNEVPEITGDVPARDALDRLGASTRTSTCGNRNE